jgi:KaiC/GvpD/RAD55 family RecA-like ATPase
MEELRITNTGISVLDSLLGGGFLSNSIIVLSYQPGTKIRSFSIQLILNKFDEKSHLIDATFTLSIKESIEKVRELVRGSKTFEKVEDTFPSDHISTIDCFNIPQEENSLKDNVCYVSNPFNVENLLSAMTEVRESIPSDKKVYWFFRDLTGMSIGVPEDELLKFCRRAFRYHKQRGDLAIYFMNEKAHTEIFFAKIYQLSDVFIKLTVEGESGELATSVQVIKSVFPYQSKKTLYYTEPGGEIKFIADKIEESSLTPVSTLPISKYFEDKINKGDFEFLISGIPTFDFLLGGGMPFNSNIVLSHDYGIRIIESLASIFGKAIVEKIHKIHINFHYPLPEYVTRKKRFDEIAGFRTDTSESFSEGTLSYIDCFNTPRSEADTREGNIYSVSNPFDVDKLLSVMAQVREEILKGKLVFWILNDLTSMSIGVPEDELLKFCRRAFRYHKSLGDLALYIMNEQAHSEMFRAKLYPLSDVYIRLRGENTPGGIETSVQVLKSVFNFNSKNAKYIINEKGRMQFMED